MKKETITVKLVHTGQWGKSLLVGDTWYNFDKKGGLTGDEFEKDKTYTVLVNESKTGKKYISQIVADVPVGVNEVVNLEKIKEDIKVDVERSKRVTAPKSRDFDAEAKGKIACALRAALYTSPAVAMYCTSWDEYLKKVDAEVIRGSEEVLKAQRG